MGIGIDTLNIVVNEIIVSEYSFDRIKGVGSLVLSIGCKSKDNISGWKSNSSKKFDFSFYDMQMFFSGNPDVSIPNVVNANDMLIDDIAMCVLYPFSVFMIKNGRWVL